MNEQEKIKGQIIGIDNPQNIVNVKVMSGEVLLLTTVKDKLKEGQKFSVVDPESGQVADVIESSDGQLKMKLADGTEKALDKLPTFT
jgi:hypothetical protein